MNTLLFTSLGFAFLFALKEEKPSPRSILDQTFQIFACVALVAGAMALASERLHFEKQDFAVWALPAVFAACSFARRPAVYSFSICGLACPFLDTDLALRVPSALVLSAALFASFRLMLLGLQERSLFYRPPDRLAGLPLLLIQAFLASLLIAAWIILPHLSA
jgi:hypothetical protein